MYSNVQSPSNNKHLIYEFIVRVPANAKIIINSKVIEYRPPA
jgi:hypothetical protein